MWGDTLEWGDTRVKAIKSDSDSDSDKQKKVARFFRKKIYPVGVTPSVVAPGVTHPSDATALRNVVRPSFYQKMFLTSKLCQSVC